MAHLILAVTVWLSGFVIHLILWRWRLPAAQLRALLAIFLSVFVAALLARLAKTLFSMVGLQPVDRILGAVFGLVRGTVLVLAAAVVVTMTPLQTSDWWRDSVGAGIASAAIKGLKPLLPQEFGKYLP